MAKMGRGRAPGARILRVTHFQLVSNVELFNLKILLKKSKKKVEFLCLLGSSLFFQPLKDLLEVGAAMLNAHLPTLLPRIYRHFALDSVWWWKIRT